MQCQAFTQKGTQCQNRAKPGSEYCGIHQSLIKSKPLISPIKRSHKISKARIPLETSQKIPSSQKFSLIPEPIKLPRPVILPPLGQSELRLKSPPRVKPPTLSLRDDDLSNQKGMASEKSLPIKLSTHQKYPGTSFFPLLPNDIRIQQLMYLPSEEILKICQNDTQSNEFSICQNDRLWRELYKRDFSDEIPKDFKGYETYKNDYEDWNKISYWDQKDLLDYAVRHNWIQKVKEVIKKGGDINDTKPRYSSTPTALSVYAAENGSLEMMKYLISQGLDIHNQEKRLIDEISKDLSEGKNIELLKYLISEGLDINKSSEILGTAVVVSHNFDLLKFLVSKGLNVKTEGKEYEYPGDDQGEEVGILSKAIQNNDLEMVKYLISHGANIHEYRDWALRTAVEEDNYDITDYLLSKGANINVSEVPALFTAIENNNLPMVKYLISKGSNINPSNTMDSALGLAVKYGDIKMIKYLISQNAEFPPKSLLKYMIINAAEKEKYDIIRYLLTFPEFN